MPRRSANPPLAAVHLGEERVEASDHLHHAPSPLEKAKNGVQAAQGDRDVQAQHYESPPTGGLVLSLPRPPPTGAPVRGLRGGRHTQVHGVRRGGSVGWYFQDVEVLVVVGEVRQEQEASAASSCTSKSSSKTVKNFGRGTERKAFGPPPSFQDRRGNDI